MDDYTLHFDGSCWPNPGGKAGYGFVLTRLGEDAPLAEGHGVLGEGPGMTNNRAEFHALAEGLKAFHGLDGKAPGSSLQVYGDSNLVVQIASRKWRASAEKPYWPAWIEADTTLRAIRRGGHAVKFDWVPRERNTRCDDLSKAHNVKEAA